MIAITHVDGTNVQFTNGTTAVNIFSPEPKEGELSLLPLIKDEPSTVHLSWPGEYDFDGIAIIGIGYEDGTISYTLQFDQIRTACLASPVHDWTNNELQKLGNIDILVLPAAEGKLAQKLIDEIEPRVLIVTPTGSAEEMAATLKTCGGVGHTPVNEFKTKGNLPTDVRDIVIFG